MGTKTNPQKIIVIGAGYSGLLAAVRLAAKTRRRNIQITLVNASDQFVQRLRLHQIATNQSFKQRSIVEMLHGTGIAFQQGMVTAIDTTRREISLQTESGLQRLGYDYLLYALGSTIERASIPGLQEFAHTLTPTGPLSVTTLQERLPELDAVHGQVVICGGGATGVESAAEFAKQYPTLRVKLVTRGEFGMFLGRTIADYMRQSLNRLGVEIQDQTIVTQLKAKGLVTSTGQTVPYDLCLWTGGFSVPTLARESGLAVNDRGQLLVDPYMRSISHPDIFAAGDASYPLEEPGVPVRMSAFTAVVTGAHAADCLSNVLLDKTPQPLSFSYPGQAIALGHHNAIGFSIYPDDHAKAPYFRGRVAFEGREFFVRMLAVLPLIEKRLPGFFYWMKGQRAASQRKPSTYQPTEQGQAAR